MNLRSNILLLALAVPLSAANADVHQWIDNDGVRQFSDRVPTRVEARHATLDTERDDIDTGKLFGHWQANTRDGRSIKLELNPQGNFAFDEEDAASPERIYMCGDWHSEDGALTLAVSTHQQRFRSGAIEKREGDTATEEAEILAARGDVLILRMQQRQLTFRRITS